MNTTTNTREVSDAMVERACEASWPIAKFSCELSDWKQIGSGPRREHHTNVVRAALEAALSTPEPAAQPEDSRCPPTYRREEAVKALIGKGWTWDGKAWAEPAAQGEAMVGVSAECYIGDKELKMLRDPDVGVCFVSRSKSDRANTPLFTLAALEAALSAPEPAAQGEGGFDVRKYVRHMADVLEAGGDLFKVDADLLRLAAAINKAANTAPPTQPAERVPEGWVLVPTDDDAQEQMLRVLKQGRPTGGYDGERDFYVQWLKEIFAASPAPSEGGKGVDRG